MTGSVALDVVIGLVFIYSLYSLMATILVEIFATTLRLRSWFLQFGVERMLDDEGIHNLSVKFFKQPLIKYMSSGSFWGLVKQPSYLTARNFSRALNDTLAEYDGVDEIDEKPLHERIQLTLSKKDCELYKSETGKFLRNTLRIANNDLEKFNGMVEKWYDDTMDRVTGWYKKWIQLFTFIVGLVVAFSFNVDTIGIVGQLSTDPKAHDAYVRMAQDLSQDSELRKLVYGSGDSTRIVQDLRTIREKAITASNVLSSTGDRKDNLVGFLITALAISLGAPFWFDLLNKLVKLRTSVQTSSTSTLPKQETSQTTSGVPLDQRVG